VTALAFDLAGAPLHRMPWKSTRHPAEQGVTAQQAPVVVLNGIRWSRVGRLRWLSGPQWTHIAGFSRKRRRKRRRNG
jgi:hypothetical protein